VRAGQGADRRPEPAEWDAPIPQIGGSNQDEIQVAGHRTMLKPVVEHEHRRAKYALGQRRRQTPDLTDEHGRTWDHAGQHQRLVAAAIEIRGQAPAVAHHDHAVLAPAALVAAAEDRRSLARGDQPGAEPGDERRLPPAAQGKIPHTDDERPGAVTRN
jgi:hypothetical protein